MMHQEIDINLFLKEAVTVPVADVRTPAEFRQGHIPGAFNIPLFTDSERKSVGITYKKSGRQQAIMKGLEYAGPKLHSYVKEARKIAANNQLLMHCWRGGMRSSAMSWLFETSGIRCKVLEGGYKSFRKKVLSSFNNSFPFVVIGGLTGAGKTGILKALKKRGEQILDLENMAHHKGSAFGHLGEPPQPSNEQFENEIFQALFSVHHDRIIWLEDESRGIGRNTLPAGIYRGIREAPVILLEVPLKYRIQRLVDEYASYPEDQLVAGICKISKKLGGYITRKACEAVRSGDFHKAAELVLGYYDKTYTYGLSKRNGERVFRVRIENPASSDTIARQILESFELQSTGERIQSWKFSN